MEGLRGSGRERIDWVVVPSQLAFLFILGHLSEEKRESCDRSSAIREERTASSSIIPDIRFDTLLELLSVRLEFAQRRTMRYCFWVCWRRGYLRLKGTMKDG